MTTATRNAMEPLLLSWPTALAASVRSECDPAQSDGCGFMALNFRLAVRSFAAMREVVESIKSSIPPDQRPWSENNRRKSAILEKTSYSIKDLMNLTGHSYGGLVSSIDAGQFPGASYTVDPATGLKRFEIPESVYHATAKHFRESCDVQGAAKLLGCSEDAVRGLVRSKCLAFAPVLPSGFRYRLSPVELSKMTARLSKLASRKSKGTAVDRVYFSAWIPGKYKTVTAGRWRILLEAIRAKELNLYSSEANPVELGDLYLLRGDLERALSRSRVKRGVTEVKPVEHRSLQSLEQADVHGSPLPTPGRIALELATTLRTQ